MSADKKVRDELEKKHGDAPLTEEATQVLDDLRTIRDAVERGETTWQFALGRACLLGAGNREMALAGLETSPKLSQVN